MDNFMTPQPNGGIFSSPGTYGTAAHKPYQPPAVDEQAMLQDTLLLVGRLDEEPKVTAVRSWLMLKIQEKAHENQHPGI